MTRRNHRTRIASPTNPNEDHPEPKKAAADSAAAFVFYHQETERLYLFYEAAGTGYRKERAWVKAYRLEQQPMRQFGTTATWVGQPVGGSGFGRADNCRGIHSWTGYDVWTMNAERRVNAYVVAITVAIMALALLWFRPVLLLADSTMKVVESMVAVLTGTGLREFLLWLVESSLGASPRFKRLILGGSYVEGKWVGYYTEDNRRRFVIEIIRQEWSSVFINGRAFDEDRTPYGQWRSLMAIVDGPTGLLRAIFSGDFMSGHYESLVTFQLDGHKAPSRMYGLIVDSAAAANAGHAWIRLRKVDPHLTDAEAIAAATDLLRDDPGDYLPRTP